jgi:hypothetical protein
VNITGKRLVFLGLAFLVAPGCSLFKESGDTNCDTQKSYRSVSTEPLLRVPSGLEEPQPTTVMPMPTGPREAKAVGPNGKCLRYPPSFFAQAGQENDPNLPVAQEMGVQKGRGASEGAAGSGPALISGASVLTNEVAGFLRYWAEVWTSRNVNGYFDFYTGDYAPPGYVDHDEWMAVQRDRFTVPASTEIDLKTVEATAQPDGDVKVKFVQRFGTGPDVRSVLKEMDLKKGGKMGGWTITREQILDVL